jgi:hypothetical protein
MVQEMVAERDAGPSHTLRSSNSSVMLKLPPLLVFCHLLLLLLLLLLLRSLLPQTSRLVGNQPADSL